MHVLGVDKALMCWFSDRGKVNFLQFFLTLFSNISKTLTDQHCEISRSQIPHPCIQNEPSCDQGYLNMTIPLPLSESEIFKFSFSTSMMMEVECAGGKVEPVNGTTDHMNTFLKSHFWHSQLETKSAWETLHVINIPLMNSSAHSSFTEKAEKKQDSL